MSTQKAVRETKGRLRRAMLDFVAGMPGRSETERIEAAAEKIEWSSSLIRQAMWRVATHKDWLPQGANLVRFCHVAEVSADWLFSGEGAKSALAGGLAEFIAAKIGRETPWAVAREQFVVDGTRALQHIVTEAAKQLAMLQTQEGEALAQRVLERSLQRGELRPYVEMARKARQARDEREAASTSLPGIVLTALQARAQTDSPRHEGSYVPPTS